MYENSKNALHGTQLTGCKAKKKLSEKVADLARNYPPADMP